MPPIYGLERVGPFGYDGAPAADCQDPWRATNPFTSTNVEKIRIS